MKNWSKILPTRFRMMNLGRETHGSPIEYAFTNVDQASLKTINSILKLGLKPILMSETK